MHLAMGAEEELCVFLKSGTHLASGAKWEPSGAATEAYTFSDGSRGGAVPFPLVASA